MDFIAGILTGYCVAGLTAVIRLGHRFHRQQLWWDDFWALVSLLFMIFTITLTLLLALARSPYSLSTSIFLLWGNFFIQPAVIWASRLSIQATVIRFLPPGRNRSISKYAFVGLVAMWIVSSISKLFYCGIPILMFPICDYLKFPTLLNLALNVAATIWLVAWPAYLLLAQMNLARSHRRLFVVCFSSASILAAVDIWQGVNLMTRSWDMVIISGHLEVMVSVVTPNVLVLAAYAYRVIRAASLTSGTSDESSSEYSTSKRSPVSNQNQTRDGRRSREITQLDTSIGPLTTVNTESQGNSGTGGHGTCPYPSSTLTGWSEGSSPAYHFRHNDQTQTQTFTLPTSHDSPCLTTDTSTISYPDGSRQLTGRTTDIDTHITTTAATTASTPSAIS